MLEAQSTSGSGPTPVTICGRTYYLRGEGDASYLAELAGLVDSKMRGVAEATGTADSLKVAILAALNIADDYFRARREVADDGHAIGGDRLARLVALLDEALAE